MSLWSSYVLAGSIHEALDALANAAGPARPVAGGTDLLLEIQQGRQTPVHTLVDVTHIPELNCLEIRDGALFIGAAVPVARVTRSPLVLQHALALAEACDLIGGPQVRNTATLGGNVAHALPAADGMIALCALGALAEIASPVGVRRQPMLELFRGPGVSALDLTHEFLLGFYIPLAARGQASAFSRIMRPQGVALPILNLGVSLERSEQQITAMRIAVGPSGPTPRRAEAVEQVFVGQEYSPALMDQARAVLRASLRFRSSPQRASAEYRYDLCEVLLETVVVTAWQRAELAVGR
jgi:carbon-monoxide dehydrogenase medium subunit